MPDLEDLIRSTLQERQALAPGMRDGLLAGAGASRRRRATLYIAISAITTVAALIPALVITLSQGSGAGRGLAHPSTSRTSSLGAGQPGAIPARMFTVASTVNFVISGPVPLKQRPCRPSDITAAAETRHFTSGTYGVVVLRGEKCSVSIDSAPAALVDSSGRRLNIPLAPDDALNGANIRPDLSFAHGDAAWGFEITGSWCGAAPAGVQIRLVPDIGTPARNAAMLTVRLTGARPACTGRSTATLVRGVAGAPGDSVLPAPSSWKALTATLTVPRRPPYGRAVTITLDNPTDHDISLEPCPHYWMNIGFKDSEGFTVESGGGLLDCRAAPIVRAHRHATLHLAPTSLKPLPGPTPTKITITVALAAGISASARVPLR
ncbi:MAG TPA: hypothetical protein VJ831_08285 [Jatrophihabitantaceae bacterium]|nr:hypothetical protein [Jatrophihabitantaceae bacterium]